MPVQENISDILEEYDHIDYGILALTNPYRYPNDIASDSGEIAFLTEKDVYRWLPLIADVVQDTSTSRLLEERIGEIVKTALRKADSTSGISERTNATSTTILN